MLSRPRDRHDGDSHHAEVRLGHVHGTVTASRDALLDRRIGRSCALDAVAFLPSTPPQAHRAETEEGGFPGVLDVEAVRRAVLSTDIGRALDTSSAQ